MTSAEFLRRPQRPCIYPRTGVIFCGPLEVPSMLHGSTTIPEHYARTTIGGLCWCFRSELHDDAETSWKQGFQEHMSGMHGFEGGRVQ